MNKKSEVFMLVDSQALGRDFLTCEEKLERDGDYVLDVLLKSRPPPGSAGPEKKKHRRGH